MNRPSVPSPCQSADPQTWSQRLQAYIIHDFCPLSQPSCKIERLFCYSGLHSNNIQHYMRVLKLIFVGFGSKQYVPTNFPTQVVQNCRPCFIRKITTTPLGRNKGPFFFQRYSFLHIIYTERVTCQSEYYRPIVKHLTYDAKNLDNPVSALSVGRGREGGGKVGNLFPKGAEGGVRLR